MKSKGYFLILIHLDIEWGKRDIAGQGSKKTLWQMDEFWHWYVLQTVGESQR